MKIKMLKTTAFVMFIAAAPLCAANNAQNSTAENDGAENIAQSDWTNTFAMSKFGGFIIGNPDAETRIAEYVSYTCSHCATFETESAPILKNDQIKAGTASLEIRNYIRDPIDLTIAVLARCGGADKFFANHNMFMTEQKNILQRASFLSPDVIQGWNTNSISEYVAAAAKTLELDKLLVKQGFTMEQVDSCLADAQAQRFINQMTAHASLIQRVRGTPGFVINDEYQPSISGLQTLIPYLQGL